MITFKQFMNLQEESPAIGSNTPAPTSKTNDFRFATRELGREFDGLKPSDYLKEPIVSFEPLDQDGEQKTSSPVLIDLEDSEDGSLDGKILHSVGNRQKMRNPNGTQYHGDLRDKKIHLRNRGKNKNRTLDSILLNPFVQSGAGGGGGFGL